MKLWIFIALWLAYVLAVILWLFRKVGQPLLAERPTRKAKANDGDILTRLEQEQE